LRRIFLRLLLAVVAFLLAGLGLCVSLVFGLIGIYFLFADAFGPVLGAFATAGMAVLVSIVLIAVGYSFSRLFKRRRAKGGPDASLIAALMGDLMGRRFRNTASEKPTSSLFASFAAGFAVGASPALREVVLDIVRS
jgi:membrane-bound ClpP family serine protease